MLNVCSHWHWTGGVITHSRNFFSTLVPGSGSFQLTNLMGCSYLSIPVWVRVGIWVRVMIIRVMVSVTDMVRVRGH